VAAKIEVTAQIRCMVGVVTTAREVPLVRGLLADLDPQSAAGLIVVMDAEVLPIDLVATNGGFSVRIAEDGAMPAPGVLYLVPVQSCAWFDEHAIRVAERTDTSADALRRFLTSLAMAWGPRSVALVAGNGRHADADAGLASVSKAGGIAVGPASLALLRDAAGGRTSPLVEQPDWEPIRQFRQRFDHGVPEASGSPGMSRIFFLSSSLLAIAQSVADAAVRSAEEGRRLRIWVPGCGKGQLVYAMGMLLAEAAVRRGGALLRLQIFATDTDEAALTFARAARYPVGAALGMDPDLRGRYTFDEGETIRISEQLRQACVFSRHDLQHDAPLPRMDLIVCDRTLEGLETRDRDAAIEALHYSLKAGGLLFSLEHEKSFPDDRFSGIESGYWRAAAPRSKVRRIGSAVPRRVLPLPIPNRTRRWPLRDRMDVRDLERAMGSDHLVAKSATLRAANRALRESELSVRTANGWLRASLDRREQECAALKQAHAKFEAFIRAVGVPLILCDEGLRVRLVSGEACTAFGLTPTDRGAHLAALLPRVPGGTELLDAARRAFLGGETLELTIRTDDDIYRVRISGSGSEGVALVFTDVSGLEFAKTKAFVQRHQQANIARLGLLALDTARIEELFEEALGILFGTLQTCSFGLILEAGGAEHREIEVVAARGFAAKHLPQLCPPGESARLLDAVAGGELAAFQSTFSFARHAFACPIVNAGRVVGVLAFYAREPQNRASAHRPFLQSVSNVLGAAIVRKRTETRRALQLHVSNVLNAAVDIDAVGDGIASALRATLAVERVELWIRTDDESMDWRRRFPGDGQGDVGWSRFGGPVPSGAEPAHRASEQSTELTVPVRVNERLAALLWLRGPALRMLDTELRGGLQSIATLLGEWIHRHHTLSEATLRETNKQKE
jgi:chemotaxis methyl-accepting protein methylase